MKDVVSMQAMIGYNDFQKDPESMNNSCNVRNVYIICDAVWMCVTCVCL